MKTEQKHRFLELRARGMSYDKIAGELKVSKQTLINWSKELATELANLKAIEMEALREKYEMTERAKIELLSRQLEAIKVELASRDLREVPTPKLIELFLKFYKLLEAETGSMTFRSDREIGDGVKMSSFWQG